MGNSQDLTRAEPAIHDPSPAMDRYILANLFTHDAQVPESTAMPCPRRSWSVLLGRTALLVALLFMAACDRSLEPLAAADPGERRDFVGNWSATGTRQLLALDAGHWAAIFDVSGSLLLTGAQRPSLGFKAEVIGFSDSQTGVQARSVWTDEHGEQVFSELVGQEAGPGQPIEGRFIGGTGRYAGVTGEYRFAWQHLIPAEDGRVSGRVVGLKGWARLRAPEAAPPPAGDPR